MNNKQIKTKKTTKKCEKNRNYLFTSKSVNYSVLGTLKEVLGHDDLQG